MSRENELKVLKFLASIVCYLIISSIIICNLLFSDKSWYEKILMGNKKEEINWEGKKIHSVHFVIIWKIKN